MPLVGCAAFVRAFDDLEHCQGKASSERFVLEDSVWGSQGIPNFSQSLRIQVPAEID